MLAIFVQDALAASLLAPSDRQLVLDHKAAAAPDTDILLDAQRWEVNTFSIDAGFPYPLVFGPLGNSRKATAFCLSMPSLDWIVVLQFAMDSGRGRILNFVFWPRVCHADNGNRRQQTCSRLLAGFAFGKRCSQRLSQTDLNIIAA